VKSHAIQSTDAERQHRPFVLESSELALDRSTALLVGLPQTFHLKCRAPITAWRRPRISMWQSHAFDPASWPDDAGIPAFPAQRSEKTH